jgi:hypothetical protein
MSQRVLITGAAASAPVGAGVAAAIKERASA